MAERYFQQVFSHNHKPVTDSMNDNVVIHRVPVIHINILKCEKKEAHRELTTSHSDATTDQYDTVVTDKVQSEVCVTVRDVNNATNDIFPSQFQ